MPVLGAPTKQPAVVSAPSRRAVRRVRAPGPTAVAAVVAALAALFAPVPAPASASAQVQAQAQAQVAASGATAAVGLEKVGNFGANPGALTMYVHRPASLPANAPVVVALHGCTQDAQTYADRSGLATFAERHGFLLVFAETTSANNVSKCFNWFQAGDNRRDQGEAASIRQMVAHAVTAYGADAGRAYVTGLSAGGAMTAVMLATYPEVFEAGASIAGLPYDCTKDTSPFICMNPGVDHTPQEWAARVRDARPGHTGPWPRLAVWQGDSDTTVTPRNADELRDQWTAVHGLGQSPDRTSAIGPNGTHREQYLAADGSVAVEVDRVPGIGHGTPVDPGTGEQSCGQAGPYFLDSICSSYWVAEFFGLSEPGAGPAASVQGSPAGRSVISDGDAS